MRPHINRFRHQQKEISAIVVFHCTFNITFGVTLGGIITLVVQFFTFTQAHFNLYPGAFKISLQGHQSKALLFGKPKQAV